MQLEREQWMSWEAGVSLVGVTRAGLRSPDVQVHVARSVHTPVGSAPGGLVWWRPDPDAPPLIAGFVSTDPEVAAFLGPRLFAGTALEHAGALDAALAVVVGATSVTGRIQVGAHLFELELSELSPPSAIHRTPTPAAPYLQQGIEAVARRTRLKVDGAPVDIQPLPRAFDDGPGARWSPCGLYARPARDTTGR